MRKLLILTTIFLLSTGLAQAQFNTVTFTPASFAGDEQFTFTIDVAGTPLASETDLYIWTWCNKDEGSSFPGRDGLTNTDWGNSPDIAKFTHVSGTVWSFTMTGTSMYGLTPGQLKNFQFLVKTKTGSKQTADSPKFPFAAVNYVPSVYRLFPSKSDQSDAISIYFYQGLATSINESRMVPLTFTVKCFDANGQVGSSVSLPVQMIQSGIYKVSFIPALSFEVPAGVTLTHFTYTVDGSYYDSNGNPIIVSGPENTKNFDVLH